MVIKLSMFKIQLQNGEFYKNKSARIQHYKSEEKAKAKIEKLGEIAVGATVVGSKAKTAASQKEKPDEIASETNFKNRFSFLMCTILIF